MKRFYKAATVEEAAEGYGILLDGRTIQSPARHPLLLPTRALAEAIAQEWRAQGDDIRPATMPLTRLAHTAIDGVRANRAHVIAAILRLGESDLLSYRAGQPQELVSRQLAWDAHLDWAAEKHGARLLVTSGIGPVEQPPSALEALGRWVTAEDDFALAALHVLASITGSLILGLAVLEGRLMPGEAFALSRLDEAYQAEQWGVDREAEERARSLAREMEDAARLVSLSRS